MPRPDLVSREYITPVSVTTSLGGSRYNGSTSVRSELVYSDLQSKPLSSRRRRFVYTNVGFVVLHLCIMLALVIFMTTRRRPQQQRPDDSDGCELCDLWCTSNCSQLLTTGFAGTVTLTSFNVNGTQEKRNQDLCCVKRRDMLSTNYEYLQKRKSTAGSDDDSPRKKIFDGIRLKDKWIEDDPHNWPRCNQSVLKYDKTRKRFTVSANGTFNVHSRIDFTRPNVNNFTQQNVTIESRAGEQAFFVDDRAQLGQSRETRNGTVIYTSTVNVIVRLQRGDSLTFQQDPDGVYASPRTLVVYQSKDDVS